MPHLSPFFFTAEVWHRQGVPIPAGRFFRDGHTPLVVAFGSVELPAGVRAEFVTSVSDLGLGGFEFLIQTRCLVRRDGVAATGVAQDTTANPVFTKMLDRWAQTRGAEWLSRHIVSVQRQLALEFALANLASS
jgi:hypothetical protein